MDGLDVIADEGLADRLDDRDAAGDRRLEEDRHLVLGGGVENFAAVLGEQRLVAGDDDLAALDGAEHEAQAFLLLAHEFDDDLDRGIIEQVLPVGGDQFRRDGDAAVLFRIAQGDLFDVEFEAEPLPEQGAILRQVFEDTCADIAQSRESDGEVLHAKGRGLSRAECGVKPGVAGRK